ncbi:hypothetical protein ACLI4Z_01665 [Natrialbaceae archaeon A-arb3/5]
MDSSDSDTSQSGPSVGGQVAVVGLFVLLGSSLLLRSATLVSPTALAGAVLVCAGVAIVLLWRRSAAAESASDGDAESDEEDDSSVWNAIPSWQYEGRHVESGGLARSEQEQALREIEQQAEELSDDPDTP